MTSLHIICWKDRDIVREYWFWHRLDGWIWMDGFGLMDWDGLKNLYRTWSNYLPSHLLTFLFQKDQKMNGGPSKRLLRRQAHPWCAFPPSFWRQVSFGGFKGKDLVVVEQLIHFVESWTCVGLYLEVAHPSPAMHSKVQIYITVCPYKRLMYRTNTRYCDYTLCIRHSLNNVYIYIIHSITCTHIHMKYTHTIHTHAIYYCVHVTCYMWCTRFCVASPACYKLLSYNAFLLLLYRDLCDCLYSAAHVPWDALLLWSAVTAADLSQSFWANPLEHLTVVIISRVQSPCYWCHPTASFWIADRIATPATLHSSHHSYSTVCKSVCGT